MEDKQAFETICAQCGKPFVKQRFNQLFCSKECRMKHKYESNKDYILNLKKIRYDKGKSQGIRVSTMCSKTQCKMYSLKYLNHCVALHDIDFQGKDCPFFK